jgi:energy-coupling factor transport system substrate-specific component
VGSDTAWFPGLGFRETIDRYTSFYVTTSLAFDAFRALGNALLVLALGGPLLAVLERFKSRFGWEPFETVAPSEAAAG